jgi:hypothetical protein
MINYDAQNIQNLQLSLPVGGMLLNAFHKAV